MNWDLLLSLSELKWNEKRRCQLNVSVARDSLSEELYKHQTKSKTIYCTSLISSNIASPKINPLVICTKSFMRKTMTQSYNLLSVVESTKEFGTDSPDPKSTNPLRDQSFNTNWIII